MIYVFIHRFNIGHNCAYINYHAEETGVSREQTRFNKRAMAADTHNKPILALHGS
jgi:hypothetical protein